MPTTPAVNRKRLGQARTTGGREAIAASILDRRAAIESPPEAADYSTLQRLATAGEHRLVVSLGGGATAGLCGNIALVRLLEELGLKQHISELWGTSAGAIVGGSWSTGTAAADMLATLRKLGPKDTVDLCHAAILRALLLRPFGRFLPDGLIQGRRLALVIDAGLKVKDFQSCTIAFRCIACSDDGFNRRKVFRNGPLLPAILSSMSLPGILAPRPPLEGEDCGYYDGGLVEKTPLISPIADHLRSGDKRKLLLIATHFSNEERRKPARGFIHRFVQSIYALEEALWAYQLKEARQRYRDQVTLLLLNPHIVEPTLFDFSHVAEHYLRARETFKHKLRNGSLALTFGVD